MTSRLPSTSSLDASLPLPVRLFRVICVATAVICLAVVLPTNLLQNLSIWVNVATVITGLLATYCYFASLRGHHQPTLFFLALLALLNPVWFLNAGANGSIGYYFLSATLFPIVLYRGRSRWILIVLLVLNFCGLLVLEYLVPSLTVHFQTPFDRLVDLATGAFCSCLILVAVAWLMVDSYDREQLRLTKVNEELAANERRLRESEQLYRDLFDLASDAVVLVDNNSGRILEANGSAATLYSYSREELLQLRNADLSAEPEETSRVTKGSPPADGAIVTIPFRRHRKKDGTVFPVEITGRFFMHQGRSVHIAAIRDITERKQTEAHQLLLGKLESNAIMAGGLAHDFNNLLATILLGVEMRQSAGGSDPSQPDSLAEARNAILAARGLTQQLIIFAQGGEPVRQVTNVEQLVRDSVTLALSGSPVVSRMTIAADLRAAELDQRQMGQVFRNLVLNAREAMPRGGLVSVAAENVALGGTGRPALPPGDYVKVCIADQGEGIPPEVLPRVFDPYFSTKQRGEQKGMGLGLTICHSVVQRHRGAITIESTRGQGTTVCVFLPATRGAVPAARAETPPPSEENRVHRGKVLVMDDEAGIRRLIGMAAEQIGCDATLASNGEEAVVLYRKAMEGGEPFDSVILDLTVRGGMGGLEAMRMLRGIDPEVRAVVMSGYADTEALQEYERHGFKASLAKPFDLMTLRAALVQALPH